MDNITVISEDELDTFYKDLNTIAYGYSKPFYWMRFPDGRVQHMITRGKLMASMAVLRMNYPYINLKLEGKLPEKKGRRHVHSPEA